MVASVPLTSLDYPTASATINGRILLAARALGLGQDDDADDGRRVCPPRRRRGAARRRGHRGGAAAEARLLHGVPELRDLPAFERLREHRVSAAGAPLGEGCGCSAGRVGARLGAALPLRPPTSTSAVRRAAAARRTDAGHRLPSASGVDGRAAGRARQEFALPRCRSRSRRSSSASA